MNNPGTTVYVHWYGKLLQGTVINDHELMGMVAVQIPLMGCHPVALYTPSHVYNSAEETQQKPAVVLPAASPAGVAPPSLLTPSTRNPSEAWKMVQDFKQAHWDKERQHVRIDALDEFYNLWKECVARKRGVRVETMTTLSTPQPMAPIMETAQVAAAEESSVDLPPITYKKPEKPIVATQLSLFE